MEPIRVEASNLVDAGEYVYATLPLAASLGTAITLAPFRRLRCLLRWRARRCR
jgi:hypothetical protein